MLTCEDCGKTGEGVFECLCPYQRDINDAEVEAILCEECYGERAADI